MTWIVEIRLGRHAPWVRYALAPSRMLARSMAGFPRANGWYTRVRAFHAAETMP